MNRLVLAFFIHSVLGLAAMPAHARFVVMQDELWATNAAIHAAISSGDMALSNRVDAAAGLMAVEIANRAAGDSLGSNHVHSVELALSNRLDSVELALTGTSNGLASAISAETQNRVAGDSANHNEIVGVQEYAEAVSNKFDSAVQALTTNLHTKVSTNHFGDVTIHGGIVVTDNIYMGEGKNLVLTNELDPSWSAVSNTVTQNSVKGSTAYGWGDHSTVGYLTNELDPYWSAVSNAVTQNAGQGAMAYGWGDHSTIGYLTDELDPYWASVSNAVIQNAVKGSTAFGWGDHELVGYLTDEIDPYWSAVSNSVMTDAIAGATAHGWGDHAAIGYLTDELDPSWSAVSNAVTQNAVKGSTAFGWGDHSLMGYLTNELDPAWAAVSNIVTQNAGKGATAYGWGDHELAGYANTNGSIYVRGNVTATSFIGDGSQLSGIQVGDKVSTNHVGDVTITGDVSATSFIGDGSQLSGVSGGVEFPELVVGSSPTTTTIPFTKDYKYYKVVATNTTDIVFDYSGIGDFTGSVLEFQLRVLLVSPLTTAVTIPAEGAGLKYVGDVDISATVDNTVQHLGMLMYSTNNVLMSHWYYEEP